jgi:site-specific DNA recombinase
MKKRKLTGCPKEQPTRTNLSIKGVKEMSKQDNESATEKFQKHIEEVMLQHHKDHMSANVKRGMLHRAKSGYAVTRPPLGYSKTETPGLYKLNNNGLCARNALQALANGKTNVVYVVAYLEMFYHVMTGVEHSGTTWLECILLDPYYGGFICHNGQLYPGLHEPILTEDEYAKLLTVLAKQKEYNSLKSIVKDL